MDYCLSEDLGLGMIAGVDEAGRGPLAGDVVAAAVILAPDAIPDGLNDSKKLSEKRREQLFDQIKNTALYWHIGRADVKEIDQLNILQATMLAMLRAVSGIEIRPGMVYVDGNRLPVWDYRAKAIVKGDAKVASIAAASVLAKVTRDREMQLLCQEYPQYGFDRHKGYPTRQHMEALERHGVSPVHRKSFGPVARLLGTG